MKTLNILSHLTIIFIKKNPQNASPYPYLKDQNGLKTSFKPLKSPISTPSTLQKAYPANLNISLFPPGTLLPKPPTLLKKQSYGPN
jgi:hypothetical protein